MGSFWASFRHYLELIRFSHTLFALPFAVAAAVMAGVRSAAEQSAAGLTPTGDLSAPLSWPRLALGVLLCMVFARSVAMAFNRLVDRQIDGLNPRTKERHLPAGKLQVKGVVWFTLLCSLGFVASTLLFWPNWLPLALSLPVLAWLCGYSYAKRFTALAHVWLGIALGLAPVCAWIALRGATVLAHPADLLTPLVLAGLVISWVTGFDIIYACQDAAFDSQQGLHSIPARLGVRRALQVSGLCHLLTCGCLLALPWVQPGLGALYGVGALAIVGLLVYEHLLVRADDLSQVNLAFFQVNAVVSLGLLAIVLCDLWW